MSKAKRALRTAALPLRRREAHNAKRGGPQKEEEAMICPYCGGKTAVYRTVSEEERVWRYRRCLCSKYHRFRTLESMAISENGREEEMEKKRGAKKRGTVRKEG